MKVYRPALLRKEDHCGFRKPVCNLVAVSGLLESGPCASGMAVEILERLRKATIEGKSDEAVRLTKEAIQQKLSAHTILGECLMPAIGTVGKLFGNGEYYLPELLRAGKAMQLAVGEIEPLLTGGGSNLQLGKYLIGTVKGDIHDIGKNIVIMMLKGTGWEVTDLGIDVAPERFCSAIKEGDYDICGMSTLVTVTMPAARQTVEAITEAGFRDKIKIMIGGAPVTQEFADKVGADEYARDAWEAVTKAKDLLDKG